MMTLRSVRTKAIALGIVLGVVFAFIQVSAAGGLSDVALVAACAAVLVLVTAAFIPSVKWGLLSGLVAVVCEPIGEFVYYSFAYGSAIAAGMLPLLLSIPNFVILPLSGMLGGAIADWFLPKRKRRGKRGKGERKERIREEAKGGRSLGGG